MKKLTIKQTLLLALTLFGMFFGAGNLIFPVHLGQLAGSNYIKAIIGFCITAVGIPILAVAAIGNTHSSGLQELASKVSKRYGIFFTCILYLTIGPFFAIPRCATVSFTTGISPFITGNEKLALLIFSLIFFGLVLFFSLRPGNITTWIGKIINPIFLIFLAILIFKALFSTTASLGSIEPSGAYQSSAFLSSFIEGYNTMDAIAGLAFGIVVINVVRSFGINDDERIATEVLKSGIFCGILMGLIYVLTIIIGVKSRTLFELSDNGGIALAQIAKYYLGSFGSVVLAITVTFACLKTSIGLVISCSDTFELMTNSKISYKTWAIIFTLFSLVISNVGLTNIITYSVPMLMFIYPLAIVLILLALFGKHFDHDTVVYKSVTIFTLIAALFDMFNALPTNIQTSLHLEVLINFANNHLPLYSYNFGWLLPSLIGLIIGLLVRKLKKK